MNYVKSILSFILMSVLAGLSGQTSGGGGTGGSITLSTTGTSGPATLTGTALNIPVYAGGSGNYVNLCSAVTLSGATCSSGVISVTSGVTSFTISAIPGTYINLQITYSLPASNVGNLIQQFNGDTTNANYAYQQTHLNTSVAGFQGAIPYVGGVGQSGGSTTIVIPFYTKTIAKVATSMGGNSPVGGAVSDLFTEGWTGTAAITSITYSISGGFTFGTGFMTIYGTN